MTIGERASQIRAGDRRAMAALIRELDDDDRFGPDAREVLRVLQEPVVEAAPADVDPGSPARNGGPPARIVVGITGGPGAGKSTLVDALVAHWRALDEKVGVVAVDPSSPLGGGAILGERVRMQRHATDAGVFIRSVASRGALGGLSRSVLDVVSVLVGGGFSRVLVETVGAGQAEIDVAMAADVTVVVVTPGQGDEVQMMKAGILELADVLVLNKADRPDADLALRDLQAMLGLRLAASPRAARLEEGLPETPSAVIHVARTVATGGEGVAELVARIEEAASAGSGSVSQLQRRRRRAAARIRAEIGARVEAVVRAALAPTGSAAFLADDVAAQRLDVETAARTLMARLAEGY